MTYPKLNTYLNKTRLAPIISKNKFILDHCKGKNVLDIGFIGHSLDTYYNSPDHWLHNNIRAVARSILGLDILEKEINVLRQQGYNVLAGDATKVRLPQKFQVIICGDLIEHLVDPKALLDAIAFHLEDDGVAIITTPNPFSLDRFLNILFDGRTNINTEHTAWFCPQTIKQVIERTDLSIDDFFWLETDFKMPCRSLFGRLVSCTLGKALISANHLFCTDFGVLLRKNPLPRKDYLPFVSIIIPTFNRIIYLKEALRSLQAQSYPKDRFEVIIVDNSPDDNTSDLISTLKDTNSISCNLKYVREPRQGLVYTRHTGAKHAQGDILLFGDDDATFDNNWVSAVIDVFSCHPQVGAVGTKIEIDWDQTPPIWIREYENSLGKLNYGGSIVIEIGLIINGGSFAIKKDILYALKGFNPGQSGQYILGDSETGLCRKMAIEHIAVGWSPFATMWHKQRKDENGTIRDIKRRMINQGICDAYYICFYDLKLRIQVREVFCRIGSLTITLTNYLLSPSCDHSLKRLILKTTYTVSFLKYIFYFGFNRSKGNSDLNRPWELTNKYAYPDLTFEIKIQ